VFVIIVRGSLISSLCGGGGGQDHRSRLRLSGFLDIWHMKVVRSALRFSHPYPSGQVPGTHFF
jgi:hypothetical protein